MIVGAIQPYQLPMVWESVKFHVERALEYEHGSLDLDKVYNAINEGRFQCLVVIDEATREIVASQTLEIIEECGGRLMNLVTTAGDRMDEWQDLLAEEIEKLAREQDCQWIQTRGRPGWLRQLKRNGYEPLFFVARRTL